MFSNHPYAQQQNRQSRHRFSNQLRADLYSHGRSLHSDLAKTYTDYQNNPGKDRESLLLKIGQAIGYCEIRRKLAPDVSLDLHTRDLEGFSRKILRELESKQE